MKYIFKKCFLWLVYPVVICKVWSNSSFSTFHMAGDTVGFKNLLAGGNIICRVNSVIYRWWWSFLHPFFDACNLFLVFNFIFFIWICKIGKEIRGHIHYTISYSKVEQSQPPFWQLVVQLHNTVETMVDQDIFFNSIGLLLESRIVQSFEIRSALTFQIYSLLVRAQFLELVIFNKVSNSAVNESHHRTDYYRTHEIGRSNKGGILYKHIVRSE